MSQLVIPDSAALAAICQRNHIRRLSLFGSRLKGTATANSDIDLLVEFEPERSPGLLGMAKIEFELSVLLNGKVDLRTRNDLSRHFRNEIVTTAEVQYERE